MPLNVSGVSAAAAVGTPVMPVTATYDRLTVMLRCFVSLPAAFSAFTVKLAVPSAAGVPDITPADLFRLSPEGRAPLATDHVIGAVPPAVRV
jgi:hypothetical protein